MDSPLQILLVDDEETFRKVVSRVMKERGGFDVVECESGQDAIAALQKHTYDVIVLDYRMETVSGLNVLQWMLEQKIDTPAIILTAAGSEHIAVEAMKLGAYDYIRKDTLEQQRLPLIIRSVNERYLFRKEKEQMDKMSKDRERSLASVELVQSALNTSARILKATLSNIPSEIDRYSQTLLPLIEQDGHDVLFKMTHELKVAYNLISVITKSLSELSDLMYQEFTESRDRRPPEELTPAATTSPSSGERTKLISDSPNAGTNTSRSS